MSVSKDQQDQRDQQIAALKRQWLKPAVLSARAYHVQSADGMVKLDAMENPYGWSGELRDQWLQYLHDADVNRYPDAAATHLCADIEKVLELPADVGLLLGNGSDEIIQMLCMAVNATVAGAQGGVLTVAPGFVMYGVTANVTGLDFRAIDLDHDFDIDLDAVLAAIAAQQPALIFLAQPNNPTGNVFSAAKVRAIIEAAEGLVIVDEAYYAFTDTSAVSWISEYNNLLVMRTFSKVGLAGLRLGMLIGAPAWLDEFDKVRLPYNINTLTQLSARFALQHYAQLLEDAARIRADRSALAESLAAMPGVKVWPSEANFFLFRVNGHSAADLHQGLQEAGVLIKLMHGAHPLLDNCLRVTVGNNAENAAFIAALQGLL